MLCERKMTHEISKHIIYIINLSKSVALLKQIESDTTTANTSLANIETNANTLASAISSSEMNVNITSLTAFTTGISNAGAGTLNVAIASNDAVSTNIASTRETRPRSERKCL